MINNISISDLLYENYIPNDPEKQDSILRKLSDYCGKSMFNYTTEDAEPPYKWDFYHSFFFSYTVVSTIGEFPYYHVNYQSDDFEMLMFLASP